MRRIVLAPLFALALGSTAEAAITDITLTRYAGGVCVNATSTGGGEIIMHVAGDPEMGTLGGHWYDNGKHGIKLHPTLPLGSQANPMVRAKDRGRDALNRQRWTVWLRTDGVGPVPLVVEVKEADTVVSSHPISTIPAGTSCAPVDQPAQ